MKNINISKKACNITDNCRFCWMCRHVCPVGNATGQERNTARCRALMVSEGIRNTLTMEEVIDNIYECTICGACTNNCLTGFDPKVFIEEVKTDAAMQNKLPSYILKLIENQIKLGNVYGLEVNDELKKLENKSNKKVLFVAGVDAIYKSPNSVVNSLKLLNLIAPTSFDLEGNDTGSSLAFLTGKVNEVKELANKFASIVNEYETVVVYNPIDYRFISHDLKEWGVEFKTNIISFHDYLLKNATLLKLKKSSEIYSLQDSYAFARDMNDTEGARPLLSLAGELKDIFLNRKEANMAGKLLMCEYQKDVQLAIARNRWVEIVRYNCKNVVTEDVNEYELLKATKPEGYNLYSLEEILLKNM